jgi:hypothetical protein
MKLVFEIGFTKTELKFLIKNEFENLYTAFSLIYTSTCQMLLMSTELI